MANQTIFHRFRLMILLVTALGLIAAVTFSLITPVQYDTSISFSINRTAVLETTEYQYDGYYAIQASDLFSQTVMSWFLTPSVLLEIYASAGIDPEISSISEITTRFKTRKFSPQNIVVRYTERDRNTAEEIATAITDVIEDKGANANTTMDGTSLFAVEGGAPVIVEDKPNLPLNAIIGLVAGLLLSLVVAYSIDYLKSGNNSHSTTV